MRKLALTLALTITIAVSAPAYSAPRFERDTNPIGRFLKYVKKTFGTTILGDLTGPIPK